LRNYLQSTNQKADTEFNQNISDGILETIKRRPATDADLCKILNLHLNELNKYLSDLLDNGKIETEEMDRGVFLK